MKETVYSIIFVIAFIGMALAYGAGENLLGGFLGVTWILSVAMLTREELK